MNFTISKDTNLKTRYLGDEGKNKNKVIVEFIYK